MLLKRFKSFKSTFNVSLFYENYEVIFFSITGINMAVLKGGRSRTQARVLTLFARI